MVNGRKLKKGYTTGSCAAAASMAAVMMLATGVRMEAVTIDTPSGTRLTLEVCNISMKEDEVVCAVIKDGGDDPDVTTGLKIFSTARWSQTPGVEVLAGEGIGRATLPGLKVGVGQPAINPVPMRMIREHVMKVLPQGKGVSITLFVPGGEEVAKKTFNPRLGIVGGISILGTTGIVNPMSESAMKESMALELMVLAARGEKVAVFVFGNYGESFVLEKTGLERYHIVKVSNYLGFMLDEACACGFESILLAGHLGKLVKVAAGIFQTHSRLADARMETLAAHAALEGGSRQMVERIMACVSTDAAADIILEEGLEAVFKRIAICAANRCMTYSADRLKVGVILFHQQDTLLAMDDRASAMMDSLKLERTING